MCCGAVVAVLIAVAAALASALSVPDTLDLSPHHPFRSPATKERYLSLYDAKASAWPVFAETTTVATPFGPTFVRLSGPREAPPLVLIHGAGGNSLQWGLNIHALARDHRTFAVDGILDYGRSVYTRRIENSHDLVAWLNATINALETEGHLHVVGLSYGGWLASQYVLRHPGRLSRLVLIAPAGTIQPLSFEWIVRAVLCALPHRYFTRSFLYWLLEDLTNRGAASKEMLDREIDMVYAAIRSFKRVRLVNPGVLSDTQLRELTVPTLFLVGENEKIYSAEAAVARLASVAPHIHTKVLPNAGHDLTIVQSELVDVAILDFLE